jgi:hypothetical protein
MGTVDPGIRTTFNQDPDTNPGLMYPRHFR